MLSFPTELILLLFMVILKIKENEVSSEKKMLIYCTEFAYNAKYSSVKLKL